MATDARCVDESPRRPATSAAPALVNDPTCFRPRQPAKLVTQLSRGGRAGPVRAAGRRRCGCPEWPGRWPRRRRRPRVGTARGVVCRRTSTGSGVSGAAAAARRSHSAGNGVAGSMSRPDTIASSPSGTRCRETGTAATGGSTPSAPAARRRTRPAPRPRDARPHRPRRPCPPPPAAWWRWPAPRRCTRRTPTQSPPWRGAGRRRS